MIETWLLPLSEHTFYPISLDMGGTPVKTRYFKLFVQTILKFSKIAWPKELSLLTKLPWFDVHSVSIISVTQHKIKAAVETIDISEIYTISIRRSDVVWQTYKL